MVSHNSINISKSKVADFCRRHHIVEFALFGSVLTSDFNPDSDIDVLVTFAPDCHYSLYDLVNIRSDLESTFGYEVDLVEKQGLTNPFRRHEILTSMEVLYAS